MTLHTVPIMESIAGLVAGAFQEPWGENAVNDLFPDFRPITLPDNSLRTGVIGCWRIPDDYDSAPKIIVPWTTIATTSDWEADIDYRAIDIGETMDPTTVQQTVNVADTAPGTARLLQEVQLSLTAANIAAEDQFQWGFFRDGTDGGDGIAADVILFGIYFQYDDGVV